MSREDPQLRIRLPIELKAKIEDEAKANGRSMNAEIVHRLDASLLRDLPADATISAKDAILIAQQAKEELSQIIFRRTFEEINKKIRIGHTSIYIELSDLELEGLYDNDFDSVFQLTFEHLKKLGYEIPEVSWDADGFMVEIPIE